MNEVRASDSDDHAADQEWVDHARGLGDQRRRGELASHLASGCERCEEAYRLWQSTVEVARRDRELSPPDDVVRQVKGTFALHRPTPRRSWAATLVFDSFRHPAPAGVRSTGPVPRQLFYRAGRYVIRLRAEGEPDSGRLMLLGQVFDEDAPGTFLRGVTVMAFTGDEAIDRTLTNGLGEFELEGTAGPSPLHLAIGLAGEAYLTVAVPVAGSAGPEAAPAREAVGPEKRKR